MKNSISDRAQLRARHKSNSINQLKRRSMRPQSRKAPKQRSHAGLPHANARPASSTLAMSAMALLQWPWRRSARMYAEAPREGATSRPAPLMSAKDRDHQAALCPLVHLHRIGATWRTRPDGHRSGQAAPLIGNNDLSQRGSSTAASLDFRLFCNNFFLRGSPMRKPLSILALLMSVSIAQAGPKEDAAQLVEGAKPSLTPTLTVSSVSMPRKRP
ncbi:hypothetical protein J2R80_004637 [Bradyrhizobium sp. USDA 4541]|nr:hypothetical protein [Bradyrhizobium sp. USDA 4541]